VHSLKSYSTRRTAKVVPNYFWHLKLQIKKGIFMKILRAKELCEILSISKTTLWRLERSGVLPASIRYSKRTTGWLESEIIEYIEKCKQA